MAFHEKIRIGVLRGGPSSEYEISLKTGAEVLKYLPEKYNPVDIFIDKVGVWHLHGMPKDSHLALRYIDVVFNALHGEYGEDGGVQEILDAHAIPYTGSTRFASAMAMNKAAAKGMLASYGIKTPYYKILRKEQVDSFYDLARRLHRSFPLPCVVKPLAKGSSVGVSTASTLDELINALEVGFAIAETLLVEEYIAGREATCGVIDNFRNEHFYSLLPIEIKPPKQSSFFDYYAKYSGKSLEICPGNFSRAESAKLQELAKKVHSALGLRHYSRSDFIVHPRRGIYFLEVNALPGLTMGCPFPKAIQAVGCSFPQFLEHVIVLAFAGNSALRKYKNVVESLHSDIV